MARPTMAQYLTYLSEKPRTYGWGALLVYDRFKANRLLAQEHIERFDEGTWLPLINFRVETESGSWTEVRDIRLDKPRLSFVNSNIANSRARLSMNVISGVVTQLRQAAGSGHMELVSYSVLDPLTAPSVRMDIMLNESGGGSVNDEGRVTLDLANGNSYSFEISSWKEMNEKLGEAIRAEFEKWPVENRVWELNVLKPVDTELNPSSFTVRTHSLANAQDISNASEEEKEEGAVVVGVAFNNEENGNFPVRDQDMPYLLPTPSGAGEPDYSMNLLYNNESWFKEVVFHLVEQFSNLQNPQLVRDSKGFLKSVSASVGFQVAGHVVRDQRRYDSFTFYALEWPALNFQGELTIEQVDKQLEIVWSVEAAPEDKFVIQLVESTGITVNRPFGKLTVTTRASFGLDVVTEGERVGELFMTGLADARSELQVEFWGSEYAYRERQAEQAAPDYIGSYVQTMVDSISEEIRGLGSTTIPFNLLRLNGLLFRSQDVATPRTLSLPGDLSLLGDLAPRVTTFALDPLETTISAGTGDTATFTLDPAQGGTPTWEVHALPGESGAVGSIANGVYTPPALDTITGTHKRVIVKATVNGNSSSALVTVVPNSVSVYPNFQIAQFASDASSPRYVLVGGDVRSELKWEMGSGSKGVIRAPNSGDGDLDIPVDKNVQIYVSPQRAPGDSGTIASLIHVEQVNVSAGGQRQAIDVILPWVTTTANIIASPASQGGVKLVVNFFNNGTGKDEDLPLDETQWAVLKGTGAIDPATGVYQPGENEGPYIIVAGSETPMGRVPIWGFVVLPMPYGESHMALLEYVRAQNIQRGA
nr:hypothetical protein [uncultured Pseudomonas sp.]